MPAAPSTLWRRIVEFSWADLSAETAASILRLRMPAKDVRRAYQLGQSAQEGTLTSADRKELAEYVRVGHILSLMKVQASQTRKQSGKPETSPTPSARKRRRAS